VLTLTLTLTRTHTRTLTRTRTRTHTHTHTHMHVHTHTHTHMLTPVDMKRVNSSVLKHLFLERVEQTKISPKTPGNAFSEALLMSCFQNFAADAAKTKPRAAQFFETSRSTVLIN